MRHKTCKFSPTTRCATVGAALALFIGAYPAWAGKSDVHKKQVDDRLQQGFDVTYNKLGGQLEVGGKGQPREGFAGKAQHQGSKLVVTVNQTKGPQVGRSANFEYDESTHNLVLGAAAKEVRITVNMNHSVSVGTKTCAGTEPGCIGDAVAAAVPELNADEVAAIMVLANDELHEMQFGDHISSALLEIAARLQAKSAKVPEKANFAPSGKGGSK